jgi:hypothetical protein
MDIVFEKGVESVRDSYYHYLSELLKNVISIIESGKTERVESLLNEKFRFLTQRVIKEVDYAVKCLDKRSMAYNEIKFSKCVFHLMFMRALEKHVSQENRDLKAKIDTKVAANVSNLNCFMKLFM